MTQTPGNQRREYMFLEALAWALRVRQPSYLSMATVCINSSRSNFPRAGGWSRAGGGAERRALMAVNLPSLRNLQKERARMVSHSCTCHYL